ncbi:MAG: hypothetical protein JWP12_2181 [Bacteroidetes bacterium]|nr:hypothetical protein [Bacteroidota bacterium]
MNFNSITDLKSNGFLGFKTIKELSSNSFDIPELQGIHLILYCDNKIPEFLETGCGPALYKKKNPNVSISKLEANWIKNVLIVYIGKAGGKNIKTTLRERLRTYFSFGQGKDVSHYGGRYIWQLKNSDALVVCWKTTPTKESRGIEKRLIQEFENRHMQKPYANIQG